MRNSKKKNKKYVRQFVWHFFSLLLLFLLLLFLSPSRAQKQKQRHTEQENENQNSDGRMSRTHADDIVGLYFIYVYILRCFALVSNFQWLHAQAHSLTHLLKRTHTLARADISTIFFLCRFKERVSEREREREERCDIYFISFYFCRLLA